MESEQAWTQFVIDGITLSNYDINKICKTDFSVKVKKFKIHLVNFVIFRILFFYFKIY
jgi:hypothetical protein